MRAVAGCIVWTSGSSSASNDSVPFSFKYVLCCALSISSVDHNCRPPQNASLSGRSTRRRSARRTAKALVRCASASILEVVCRSGKSKIASWPSGRAAPARRTAPRSPMHSTGSRARGSRQGFPAAESNEEYQRADRTTEQSLELSPREEGNATQIRVGEWIPHEPRSGPSLLRAERMRQSVIGRLVAGSRPSRSSPGRRFGLSPRNEKPLSASGPTPSGYGSRRSS